MTVLRTVLATLVAATGLVLAAPTPAFACSCVMADTPQFVTWADVVVVGEVTEITPPPERAVMSSGDPATYTVDVDEILKGTSPGTVDVRSAVSGGSCGLEGIEVGREYVVFAAYQDIEGKQTEELWASLCGGTTGASDSKVAEVEAVTGPGHPPAQPQSDPSTETEAEAETDAGTSDNEKAAATSSGIPVWAWVGSAAAVLGVGGLLVARRRQSGA